MPEIFRFLTRKLRGWLAHLPYLPKALQLVWRASPRWTVVWLILLVVQGLLPVAIVLLTRSMIDGLVAATGADLSWAVVRPALVSGLLLIGAMLAAEVLRSMTGWVRAIQAEIIQDYITGLIHAKSMAVDLAFFEFPDYYDHLHRAMGEAGLRPLVILDNAGGILQNAITLVGMAGVLLPFGLWLPVALFLSTVPAFYVVIEHRLREHQFRLRATPDERRMWYYNTVLTGREPAAELRLFGLGPHFQAAYRTVRARLRAEHLRLVRDQGMAEVGAGAVALFITGASLVWMLWRALLGLFSVGDLVMFFQAFNQGQRLTRSLFENVGLIYSNSLFLGNLFEFLALDPQIVDPPLPVPAPSELLGGIRFEQVTFTYPGSQRPALQDFSLTLHAGRLTAIVGPNGAGKSTLIKLICRLYDPQSGRITVEGMDLRDLSVHDLRRLITVLFQEPVHYSATVAENIALGDVAAMLDATRIQSAAEAAGADEPITRLPQGFATLLGKWFAGGMDLSVGEWQRLALARAFLRQAPIVLLDEPTSALDSWAETDWLMRLRSLVAGRTALIITHRFTTAMRADVIHVMRDGCIVESGSHEELLASGGSYAAAWTAQMRAADQAPAPAG